MAERTEMKYLLVIIWIGWFVVLGILIAYSGCTKAEQKTEMINLSPQSASISEWGDRKFYCTCTDNTSDAYDLFFSEKSNVKCHKSPGPDTTIVCRAD